MKTVSYKNYTVTKHESGTIEATWNGVVKSYHQQNQYLGN